MYSDKVRRCIVTVLIVGWGVTLAYLPLKGIFAKHKAETSISKLPAQPIDQALDSSPRLTAVIKPRLIRRRESGLNLNFILKKPKAWTPKMKY